MALNLNKRGRGLSLFLVAIPILFFGFLFGGIGLLVWNGAQPYDDGVLATGTVVGHERSSDGDSWASVVEFETEAGEQIVFSGSTYSSGRDPLGSDVRVSYRADDPAGARNLDDGGRTLGLIFLGIGLIAVMGAVLGLIVGGVKRLRRAVSGRQELQSYGNLTDDPPMNVSTFDSSGTDFISGEDRGF